MLLWRAVVNTLGTLLKWEATIFPPQHTLLSSFPTGAPFSALTVPNRASFVLKNKWASCWSLSLPCPCLLERLAEGNHRRTLCSGCVAPARNRTQLRERESWTIPPQHWCAAGGALSLVTALRPWVLAGESRGGLGAFVCFSLNRAALGSADSRIPAVRDGIWFCAFSLPSPGGVGLVGPGSLFRPCQRGSEN